jgi:hypothetical protein
MADNNVDYSAIAQELIAQVMSMRAKVPFITDRPKVDLRRLNSGASVPDEFIDHLTKVVTSSPKASAAVDDVTGMLDMRRFAAAFIELETDLRALADSIHATSVSLRHESGILALNAYATVQGLLRQKGGQDLGIHVRTLRKTLGRGRKGRAVEEPSPAPGPVTNPTT